MTAENDETPPPEGRVSGAPELARYEIQRKVGEGATAVVYRARDRSLHRIVALKVLKETTGFSDIGRQRFRREAQASAGLSHPNLVTVYDVGEEEGRLYFAMELVEGRPLVDLIKEGGRPLRELVSIVEKSARGLGAAHQQGIVHRDVKPANILVGPNGEPKVGDFGLAHLIDSTTELTRSGVPLGTPLYMAPEQVEGRTKDLNPRTDVFSLGAILYEIATGRPPYLGESVVEIYAKIVRDDPEAPRRIKASIPTDLETIILKALDRDAVHRYETAEALADDLRRFLDGEPVGARPVSPAYRLYRKIRKSPILYALAGGMIFLVALGSILWFKGGRRLKDEQEVAVRTLREKAQIALDAAIDLRRSGRNDLMQRYLPVLESAYREAVERAPDAAEVEYLPGRMERMLMRDAKALHYQERALRKDPDFAPALYERVLLLSKKYGATWVGSRSQDEAERLQPALVPLRETMMKDLERLLRVRDVSPLRAAHLKAARGILLYYQSKPREAREILEQVVREDPLLEEGWETLALAARYEAYRASGEQGEQLYKGVENIYTQALTHDRGYATHWVGRGFSRLHLAGLRLDAGQDPAELVSAAVEDYAEAERLAPESPEVVVQHAMMYFTMTGYEVRLKQNPLDDFAKGDAEFAKAIALDPALSKAWVQRGRLRHLRADYLRRRGETPDPDYDEADRLLMEAARLDPMSRALKHLGDLRDDRANHAMNRGGDPKLFLDAAEEAYTKAIQSAASTASVHVSRGFSRLRRGRYFESRKETPSARDTYGAALEDFREAVRLSPENSGGAKDGIAEAEARLAALQSP